MIARERPSRLVVIGHPVAHSLSPVFQNAALEHCGVALRYERLDVSPDALDETLDAFAREGTGGNATIPHKEAMAARASCSPLAARVGAVNTFWHEDGVLIGHNTDVAGASATIGALCPNGVRDLRCAVLGAGGSAAAVLVALHTMGCGDIRVATRAPERAHHLADRLDIPLGVLSTADDAVAGAGLVINATPIGMVDDALPVSVASLPAGAAVFDLVYRRGETAFVRGARASGHVAVDGLGMLLEQGAVAFECWFGITAPRDVMREAVSLDASARPS